MEPEILPDQPGQPEPEPLLSAKFIIFALVVISAAVFAGSLKSGRISLNRFLNAPKVAGHATPLPAPSVSKVPSTPAVPPKAGTFVVTSISLTPPSFAIINGVSRVEGDPVDSTGTSGWKVRRIMDDSVVLQNGATFASLPVTTPGLKPLDDQLHPLN